jgi:hypothetical protein
MAGNNIAQSLYLGIFRHSTKNKFAIVEKKNLLCVHNENCIT